jgi:hypothetical protein
MRKLPVVIGIVLLTTFAVPTSTATSAHAVTGIPCYRDVNAVETHAFWGAQNIACKPGRATRDLQLTTNTWKFTGSTISERGMKWWANERRCR